MLCTKSVIKGQAGLRQSAGRSRVTRSRIRPCRRRGILSGQYAHGIVLALTQQMEYDEFSRNVAVVIELGDPRICGFVEHVSDVGMPRVLAIDLKRNHSLRDDPYRRAGTKVTRRAEFWRQGDLLDIDAGHGFACGEHGSQQLFAH